MGVEGRDGSRAERKKNQNSRLLARIERRRDTTSLSGVRIEASPSRLMRKDASRR